MNGPYFGPCTTIRQYRDRDQDRQNDADAELEAAREADSFSFGPRHKFTNTRLEIVMKPIGTPKTWTDRAMNLSQWLEAHDAPPEVKRKADDAIQHFIWATDCRRQARNLSSNTPGWGAKADKAHYHGKKCFNEAVKWQDQYKSGAASKEGAPFNLDSGLQS